MTPESVQEKYGLAPGQYADFAALRGDPSDNLPGIPGVGEKTATKWITTYGNLAGLVDHADEITGKTGDALRAALSQVLVNRRLTELVREVPLDLALDHFERQPIDLVAVDDIFDALQFRVLRDRLADSLAAREPAATEVVTVEPDSVAPGGWGAWLDVHAAEPVALAISGTWGAGSG
ncbi:MAG: 5'-3' exonuclease H3TH domain-containing protein, partial [Candidatus Nanopelagicales bacterium]